MKRFQRKKEDFLCKHCNKKVRGDGYTDHCPHCLWSRHVDINPGDRDCDCQGMMKPIGVTVKGDSWTIHYQCQDCGYRHKVKTVKNDNFDEILRLSDRPVR